MKVGIISQARTGSTRLPSKVLKVIKSKPLLEFHIRRLLESGLEVHIATTINQEDDQICEIAQRLGVPYYRGSESNVLDRFYQCSLNFDLDIIIRVTSDCPLIDGNLINKSLDKYIKLNDNNIYMSNCIERSFPRGLDFEIFSFAMLKESWLKALDKSHLEHVTPYMRFNPMTKFVNVTNETDNSKFRITVDTKEDFQLIKILITDFSADKLNTLELIEVLIKNPLLMEINGHIEQKKYGK